MTSLYHKPVHPYKLKRHKGTFSLHDQAIMLHGQFKPIIDSVHGVRVRKSDGLRIGYIKRGPSGYMKVEQLGKAAWITIPQEIIR